MSEIAVATHECICEKPLRKFDNGNEYHNFNCPQDRATGLMCHEHFEMRNAKKWQTAECASCREAIRENADRIQKNNTIDPNQPYGQHISLTCKNHPSKRWHTKNIDFVGARTIFFSGDRDHDHEANPDYVPHSLLREGVYGPIWMSTSCSMRQEFYGTTIQNTDLDCECNCSSRDLTPVKN